MIQNIRTQIVNNKQLQDACKKVGVSPDSVVAFVIILITVLLDRTFIGHALNNTVCLFFILQDAVCVLKSPNPNVKDMRKCLIVLTSFAAVIVVEPYLKTRIPLFAALKIAGIIGLTFKQSFQEIIQRNIIDVLPIGGSKATVADAAKNAVTKGAEAVKKVAEETNKNK